MQLRESLMESKAKALDANMGDILHTLNDCGFTTWELLNAMSRHFYTLGGCDQLVKALEDAATTASKELDR